MKSQRGKRVIRRVMALPKRRARNLRSTRRVTQETTADTREIPIDLIDWSRALREVQIAHVGRLSGAASLPPVIVWEFERGRYRGVDGFHRWHLVRRRGEKTIQALVRRYPSGQDPEQQFEFDCVRMNIQHGLPLTREERDRAIMRLWNRWGRTESRPRGVSLEDVGRSFNLTRQRIQQILLSASSVRTNASHPERVGEANEANPDDTRKVETQPRTRSSGYSRLGRFSAAVKRLSSVLGDTEFIGNLCQEHETEVRMRLQELRVLLDDFLRGPAQEHKRIVSPFQAPFFSHHSHRSGTAAQPSVEIENRRGNA